MERRALVEQWGEDHAPWPRARRRQVDEEYARLFTEAIAGIDAGQRPGWLPTWAYRKARSLRRRRSLSRRWLGEHLGFVRDLAMREACLRYGTGPAPRVSTGMRSTSGGASVPGPGLDRRSGAE